MGGDLTLELPDTNNILPRDRLKRLRYDGCGGMLVDGGGWWWMVVRKNCET